MDYLDILSSGYGAISFHIDSVDSGNLMTNYWTVNQHYTKMSLKLGT